MNLLLDLTSYTQKRPSGPLQLISAPHSLTRAVSAALTRTTVTPSVPQQSGQEAEPADCDSKGPDGGARAAAAAQSQVASSQNASCSTLRRYNYRSRINDGVYLLHYHGQSGHTDRAILVRVALSDL